MLYPLLLLICGALAVPQPGVERRSAAPQMTPLKNAHIVVLSDEVGDSEAFFNSMNLGLPNGAMHFYNHAMKGFSAQVSIISRLSLAIDIERIPRSRRSDTW